MSWISDVISAGGGIIGGAAGIIQGNQTRQKNKGLISEAYRQNVAQTNLQQANTREDSNESLNARGVLSPGAARPNPTSITQAVAGSGGKGGGGGITGYLPQANVGAVGAANTLGGGENAQMTDQFALADKANQQAETQALNQNNAQYDNTIGNAVSNGVKTAAALSQGGGGQSGPAIPDSAFQVKSIDSSGSGQSESNAQPGSITSDTSMQGQYGPVNPSWAPPGGTRIGSGQSNASFNVG